VTHPPSFQLLGRVVTADHHIMDESTLRRLVLEGEDVESLAAESPVRQ
jgi:hypothetical protein